MTFQSRCLLRSPEEAVAVGLTPKSRDTPSNDNPCMLQTKDQNTETGFCLQQRLLTSGFCNYRWVNKWTGGESDFIFTWCVFWEEASRIRLSIFLWRLFSAAYTQLIPSLLNRPNDDLFIRLLLTAHNLPQSRTSPMLIVLSTLISLLIVVDLFILVIKLSSERLRVPASTDQPVRPDECISNSEAQCETGCHSYWL